ncbi:MAG: sigma-70 family RNA polymerase sigma factor [Anaerolineales bacterium]
MKMLEASDRGLVELSRSGDPAAFGELVRRYQTSVYNVCYRLLGERRTAQDLAQEAFIRAYQRLRTYDVERPFGPWMRRVAANLCLNQMARTSPPSVSLDDERDEPRAPAGSDPAVAHEQAESAAALRAAIARLPPHYRAVIELRHFHDLSYEEIAAALKLPLSDVKSHLFRARQQLANSLRPEAHD